jgi:hypothetical protein
MEIELVDQTFRKIHILIFEIYQYLAHHPGHTVFMQSAGKDYTAKSRKKKPN